MNQNILVIPGLGDENTIKKLEYVFNKWKNPKRDVFVFDSKWHKDESANHKLNRLLKFYDKNESKNNIVIAYSAGGPLALSLYKKRKQIDKLILISSKLKGSNTIGKKFQIRAPALLETVKSSEVTIDSLNAKDLKNIVCFKPIFDEVVPIKDMKFPSVKSKTIPFVFHTPSIAFTLLFQVKKYF